MSDLQLYTRRGKRWTKIDADFYPQLHGEHARRAGELVLEAARHTLSENRRAAFLVALGSCSATIRPSTAMLLDHLRDEFLSEPGSVYVTLAPNEEAQTFIDAFQRIESERRWRAGVIDGETFVWGEDGAA